MTPSTPHLSSLFAITALITGCANAPAASPAPSTAEAADCRQVSAEIAGAEVTRHAALEQEKDAWKGLVPFVVVARYTNGRSAREKTDRQLEQLRADYVRLGCDRTVDFN